MGAHVLERPRTEVDPGKTDFFFFFNARKLVLGKAQDTNTQEAVF